MKNDSIIVSPEWKRRPAIGGPGPEFPRDYLAVRSVQTYGTFTLLEILDPNTTGRLAALCNVLDRQAARKIPTQRRGSRAESLV